MNPGGVTPGVISCEGLSPVAAGAELQGDELSLDLELHTAAIDDSSGFIEANNSSGSPGTMVIHTSCAQGHFTYHDHEADFGPGTVADTKASCPLHTKLVGGGVRADEQNQDDPLAHQVEIGDSHPADGQDANSKPDDGWTATINNSPNSDTLVTVTAACASRGHYRVVSSDPKHVPINHQVSTKAKCPRGSQVTSGGVSITDNDPDLEVAGSFPIDGPDRGSKPDNGWQGVANNQSFPDTQTKAWAVCKL